jgi:acyl-CoA thioesterase
MSHAIKFDQSIFGFRVAASSFSVGILAFVPDSRLLHSTGMYLRYDCDRHWDESNKRADHFWFGCSDQRKDDPTVLSLIVCYTVDGKTAVSRRDHSMAHIPSRL